MNIYEWKNQLNQQERSALMPLFKISRDVGATKVMSTAQGDIVVEDGVTDSSLTVLDGYSVEELKAAVVSGVIPEKKEVLAGAVKAVKAVNVKKVEPVAPVDPVAPVAPVAPEKKKVGRPKSVK